MMNTDCQVCKRIQAIQKSVNPYFVAEFPSGYAVLGDFQFYTGYTVFLSKTHATELHQLDKPQRTQFLEDMAKVAEAVYQTFHPVKLNYELLGNVDNHMHWHLFPRHANDPDPTNPVSVTPPEIRNADSTRPSQRQLETMKVQLRDTLKRLSYA